MNIISFKPNETGTELVLELSGAENADTLQIWNDATYKDYGKAIDLSDKLNGNSTQTITITADDLSKNDISGIHFIQVQDNNTLSQALTSYLISYEECILNKLMDLKLCDDCLNRDSLPLINAQTLLTGLNYAVKKGFIEEAKSIRKALDKYCSGECKTCGKYPHIINNNYYDYGIG